MSGNVTFSKKMLRAFSDVQSALHQGLRKLFTKVCARRSVCAWDSKMSTKAVCLEIKRRLLFASRVPHLTSFSVLPVTVTNGSRYCAMLARWNAVLVALLGADLCLLVWAIRGVSTRATKDLATRMDKANERSLEPRLPWRMFTQSIRTYAHDTEFCTNYSDVWPTDGCAAHVPSLYVQKRSQLWEERPWARTQSINLGKRRKPHWFWP